MKIKLLMLMVLSWTYLAGAQLSSEDYVGLGTNDLVAQDIFDANTNFDYALTLSPTNFDANFFAAFSRLLVLPQLAAGSNFLNQLNVPDAGRNIYDWTAMFPRDVNGQPIFPANYNSSVAIGFFRNTVIPLLVSSATYLATITDTNYTISLGAAETALAKFPGEDVTLDYGDIQILRAGLAAAEFAGYTLNAQNADVVIPALQSMGQADGLTIQGVLAAYPNLLALSTPADLAASKAALTNAIADYFAASDFIRNVRAPGADRLFNLDPSDAGKEAKFRTELTNALLSLNGPVQVDPPQTVSLDLSNYFSGAKTLRSFVPQFTGNAYVNDSLPDYTFGGILQGLPSYQIEAALVKHFPSLAGIYTGYVYDNNDYYYGSIDGSCSLIINSSQQVTLIADDYTVNNDMPGIFLQFNVDAHGNVNITNNNYSASGSFSGGSFYLTLNYSSGLTRIFSGYEQSPAFQGAGYYTGSFSGSSSGTLDAVVGTDGSVEFCTIQGGVAQDGGGGYISTDSFSGSSDDNTEVSGTYNPTSFAISGYYTNFNNGVPDAIGKFTLTRSTTIPGDVAPAITTAPVSQTVAPGSNPTFSVTASGSGPLSYQWYVNGQPILGANSAKLVLTNVSLALDQDEYSVSVVNTAGSATATAVLGVKESVKPTLSNLNITSTETVSNGTLTVTGEASSPTGVSSVMYDFNNQGWTLASSDNGNTNWQASLNLQPGANTLQVYAVEDASQNFVYVADYNNNLVRRIAPDGTVTTFVGDTYDLTNIASFNYPYNGGYADGIGGAAMFYGPSDVAVDASGNIYLADSGNNLIRKISSLGTVTTLAGDTYDLTNSASPNYPTNSGFADGVGAAARFNNPVAVAVDSAGNVYVADSGNSLIRKISPAGKVTTLAGDTYDLTNTASPNYSYNSGYADGVGTGTLFDSPEGLALDSGGNVYVADYGNNLIRKISPAGKVTTLAGDIFDLTNIASFSNNGYADGASTNAMFNEPYGVAVDSSTNVYVADLANNLIREISPAGMVTTLAGDTYDLTNGNPNAGYADGTGPATQFNSPISVSLDVFGNVYVADVGNNLIREISPGGTVSTLAGDTFDLTNTASPNYPHNYGYADGVGADAQFYSPAGVAVDDSGVNLSTTNVFNLTYKLSAPITLNVVGLGTISGASDGELLPINQNDSITAMPATGFKFVSWSNSLSGAVSNTAGLTFDMESNLVLTATFADVQAPTLTITNPATTTATVSNANFTVSGKAADNWVVANVFCAVSNSLGQGGYSLATGTTNWFQSLTLEPGNNTIQAYAVDSSGNLSLTNSVVVNYVETAPLAILTNGLGSFSPNDQGQLLRINNPYTITAEPGAGFKFVSWTNGLSGAVSNSAALSFIMQSNLVLTATFADIQAPTIAITNPSASTATVSNANYTVRGKASDNWAVASVFCAVSNVSGLSAYSPAIGTTTWYQNLTLQPGNNTIKAYAVDSSGNISLTNSVVVNYVATTPLSILTNGLGSFSPNDQGQLLRINNPYSITAEPATGFKFVSWTNDLSGAVSNSAQLTFSMESNLVLTATFADIQAPTIAITNPAASLATVSNSSFTVRGKASDNWVVSNVFCAVSNSLGLSPYSEATGTTNWFQSLSLEPGNNTIKAYAVDSSGNISLTNSVVVNYVETAPLSILTNGLGSFSPNDQGQLLRINNPYSITAEPATGFKFVSWTNGLSGAVSNSAQLTFTMQSNLVLTATFADIQAPTIAITNPAASLATVSNASFTVRGKAADNWAVSNVFCAVSNSLGLSPYSEATGTTNWFQSLSLEPGNNTIKAYAVDSSGNISLTNSVVVNYVETAPLSILTNGLGSFSPNDQGQLLRINNPYSITALPATGFKFVSWTNGLSGAVSNSAQLTFTMQSNLVLTATFADIQAPTITITNPASSVATVSNASFTVQGKAADNWAVSNVFCAVSNSLGLSPYSEATGTTNWFQSLTLEPGTNTIKAYAVDSSGNFSLTNSVVVNYVLTAPLTLLANGLGSFSPNDQGQLLRINNAYTITAVPASGFKFVNWTNGLTGGVSNTAALTFIMQSNLVLTATFTNTVAPVVTITSPAGNETVATNYVLLAGKVTDNEEVSNVWVDLNNTGWNPVTTFNGTNWTYGLSLDLGTNLIQVMAEGVSGLYSKEVDVSIARSVVPTDFIIYTNADFPHPDAQIAFDGTNYLVAFQTVVTNNNNSNKNTAATAQFVSRSGDLIGSPLSLNPNGADDPPTLAFDGTNYLAAWADYSDTQAGVPILGAFISPDQQVSTVVQLSQSTTVDNFGTMVFGGGVYFMMWSDSRQTSGDDSIYGAMITPQGTSVVGDFQISPIGGQDEVGQGTAGFDGTNFLATWGDDNGESGQFSVNGRLISPQGTFITDSFTIYTNSTLSAGKALECVAFDGTKYLVLITVGADSGSDSNWHIEGRFVTTSGEVLTNQISITTDAGPQIVPCATFDGNHYLVTWNQGWNPFTTGTTGPINARYFDTNGLPTSAEFSLFTPTSGETALWAPVLFDGSQYFSVGALGLQIGKAGSGGDMKFTNAVLKAAIIKP